MTSGNIAQNLSAFGGRTIMMVLRRLLTALKTRWWIPLVTMALATVSGAFYVAQMPPPNYVSVAKMWVAGKVKIPEGSAYMEEQNQYYGTQAELMQSKTVIQRAHSRVAAQHPDLKYTPIVVRVAKSPQASIFILQATGADPTYPRLFLEALMEEFLMFKREAKNETSEGAMALVAQQKIKSEEDLRAATNAFEEFTAQKPMAVMQEEESSAKQAFSRWHRELQERKVELATINSLIALDEMPEDRRPRSAAPNLSAVDIAADQQLGSDSINQSREQDYKTVEQRIQYLKIERDELAEYLKPAHPKMEKITQEIETSEKILEAYKGKGREELKRTKASLEFKIRNLEQDVAKASDDIVATTRVYQQAVKLQANVEALKRRVENFGNVVNSVDMGQGLDQDNLQIFEHASTAAAPPLQKAGPVAGFSAAGLIVGMGIVLLLVWFDDRLGSLAELRANVDCLVVGQVPELEMKKGQARVELLEPDDVRHHFAESYRNIRSSLLFMATDGVRPKTILITSSIPAEGKSTVTSNLARAMAFTGSKVLLIEGDQRRGQLHELFGVPSEPGLAEILRGELKIAEVVRQTNLPNLSFISRGKPPRNPGELFLGTNMDRLLQDVYNEYDYILIDSAPVLAADDTTSLAPKMDGVLFVVRNSYTSAKLLRQSMELLHQRQVRILGVVYNRADTRAGDYNYYNYPQYYISATNRPEKEDAKKAKKARKNAKAAKAEVNGNDHVAMVDVEPIEKRAAADGETDGRGQEAMQDVGAGAGASAKAAPSKATPPPLPGSGAKS